MIDDYSNRNAGVVGDDNNGSLEPVVFPKEFETTFRDHLDKRFLLVLFAILLLTIVTIIIFERSPPAKMSHEEIKRIQEKFSKMASGDDLDEGTDEIAAFVDFYESMIDDTAPVTDEKKNIEPFSNIVSNTKRVTGTASPSKKNQVVVSRGQVSRRTASKISDDASDTDLLGLLTDSKISDGGQSADEILGGNISNTNFQRTLSNVASVRGNNDNATNTATQQARGARDFGSGTINAVVDGLDKGKAKSVGRTGELVINKEEPLIEAEEDGQAVGTRASEDIAVVISKHSAAIQYCYQKGLKRDPEMKGKIVIRFTVLARGTVENAEIVSSTLKNTSVESCILSRIKRWDDFGMLDDVNDRTTVRQVYTFGY